MDVGQWLRSLGLAEYETKALAFARSPDTLRRVHRRLVEARASAPLFDTGRFARHLEAAYAEMWRRHESGLEPASFHVRIESAQAAASEGRRRLNGPTNAA